MVKDSAIKRVKKKKLNSIDYGLFYSILILLAIGLVMVYSASSFYSKLYAGDSTAYLKKQAVASVIGLIAMFILMKFDYHKLKRITIPLVIINVPLLIAVWFFPAVKGAKRWIPLGPLGSFQPSELTKYTVVLFLALSLTVKGDSIKKFLTGVVPYLLFSGVAAGFVLLQKNLSIASLIMIVTFIMLFCDGAKKTHLFLYVFPPLGALAGLFIAIEPYRVARLMNFLDPWKDASGDGYQLIQSFYSLGAGGLLGLGIGQSREKTLYMPEPHNDFIFSIIGEELGFIGCTIILLMFILLIWRGIVVALNAKDTYGMLLATGIISVIAVQCIINIAVVTGSMPVTGVPLPFISYGGTSLMITLSAMGILLNISSQSNQKLNQAKVI